MSEEKKVLVGKFEGGKLTLSLDTNKDGEPSVKVFFLVNEGLGEAIKYGKDFSWEEDVKVDFSLTGGLKIRSDLDGDGIDSAGIDVDFGEALDEIKDKVL